jgi:hypothetical protein
MPPDKGLMANRRGEKSTSSSNMIYVVNMGL